MAADDKKNHVETAKVSLKQLIESSSFRYSVKHSIITNSECQSKRFVHDPNSFGSMRTFLCLIIDF